MTIISEALDQRWRVEDYLHDCVKKASVAEVVQS